MNKNIVFPNTMTVCVNLFCPEKSLLKADT